MNNTVALKRLSSMRGEEYKKLKQNLAVAIHSLDAELRTADRYTEEINTLKQADLDTLNAEYKKASEELTNELNEFKHALNAAVAIKDSLVLMTPSLAKDELLEKLNKEIVNCLGNIDALNIKIADGNAEKWLELEAQEKLQLARYLYQFVESSKLRIEQAQKAIAEHDLFFDELQNILDKPAA